jgi:hypothetical protein
LIAGPAISLFIVYAELVVAPKRPYLSGYMAIGANLAIFALFSWITSPVIVGPGPAIVIVMLLAAHQRLIRTYLLGGLVIAATLLPWVLEWSGLSGARTSVVGGDIVLHTPAAELGPTATIVALVIYLVMIVNLAALLARLQDDERRAARQKLELQSWQLQQLVSESRIASGPVTIH